MAEEGSVHKGQVGKGTQAGGFALGGEESRAQARLDPVQPLPPTPLASAAL